MTFTPSGGGGAPIAKTAKIVLRTPPKVRSLCTRGGTPTMPARCRKLFEH